MSYHGKAKYKRIRKDLDFIGYTYKADVEQEKKE